MTNQRKKRAIEYHFVDMNDPDRYKKIKVARACDFCRKRKSKCDIGIPGSGTCSNCKKSNQNCAFSPVSSTQKQEQQQPQRIVSQLSSNSGTCASQKTSPLASITSSNGSSFIDMYQSKNPFFSVDQRGHCGYEKHSPVVYDQVIISSPVHELPPYSKRIEQELFDIYFTHVHPFFPIMDRFYVSQALRYDNDSLLPTSLRWAVMAVALHFTHQYQDPVTMAASYHHHASIQLDHTPCLLSLQTLFILYKYQELITPVGSLLSTVAAKYLNEIQFMIQQLKQQDNFVIWTGNDEFLCRAGWILKIIISMSSAADERWKGMFEGCVAPTRFPTLTESEQYDRNEINTTCNLIHLINITILYSKTLCLISDQCTLFVHSDHPGFVKLAADLKVWKSRLPSHIAMSLITDPSIVYSTQNHTMAGASHDSSMTDSFTSYICLIYDILDLLICIHRNAPSTGLSSSNCAQIAKKASQIYSRSYSFAMGDTQEHHFSRMACIQGSRIVSFGLTLALQAHSFCHEQKSAKTLEDLKAYYTRYSLSFKIFDDMKLSPKLYMTIQSLRAQFEAKEQLDFTTSESVTSSSKVPTCDGQQTRDQYNSPRSSSANSSALYYYNAVSTNSTGSSNSTSQQYHQRQPQEEQWQDYSNQHYQAGNRNNWSQNGVVYYHQLQKQDKNRYGDLNGVSLMPAFDKDFGMSPSSTDLDPLTPSLADMDDMYFQPQPFQNYLPQPQRYRCDVVVVSIASRGSSDFFDHLSSPIHNFKSCRYKKII